MRGRLLNGRGRRGEAMYLLVRMIYTDLYYYNTDDNVLLRYLTTWVSCVPYRLPTYIFIVHDGGDGGMPPMGSKRVSRQHNFAELQRSFRKWWNSLCEKFHVPFPGPGSSFMTA